MKDALFGETWVVVAPELRDDGCLFYLIRNETGQELLLAEWAVPFFELQQAA
jgi:hypothetical protein